MKVHKEWLLVQEVVFFVDLCMTCHRRIWYFGDRHLLQSDHHTWPSLCAPLCVVITRSMFENVYVNIMWRIDRVFIAALFYFVSFDCTRLMHWTHWVLIHIVSDILNFTCPKGTTLPLSIFDFQMWERSRTWSQNVPNNRSGTKFGNVPKSCSGSIPDTIWDRSRHQFREPDAGTFFVCHSAINSSSPSSINRSIIHHHKNYANSANLYMRLESYNNINPGCIWRHITYNRLLASLVH